MIKDRGILPSKIEEGKVHVWLFYLESIDSLFSDWEELLSSDEIARARRFKFERDRRLFIYRRVILRRLLARYLEISPRDIYYDVNPNGKLSLPSYRLAFNLTTCQYKMAIAITRKADIGVDLEQVRSLEDLPRMIDYCMTGEEAADVFMLSPAEQLDAFYFIWTQKEAFLKAKGQGLTSGLKHISVSVDPEKPGELLTALRDNPSHWKMVCSMPQPGWRLAICTRMNYEPEVRYFFPDIGEFTN